MKYHIHIKADQPGEIKEELRDAAYLLTGFYEAVKDYDDNYGGSSRAAAKREWKEKVKQWIDKNKIKAP